MIATRRGFFGLLAGAALATMAMRTRLGSCEVLLSKPVASALRVVDGWTFGLMVSGEWHDFPLTLNEQNMVEARHGPMDLNGHWEAWRVGNFQRTAEKQEDLGCKTKTQTWEIRVDPADNHHGLYQWLRREGVLDA